jgi:hypothetical protein
LQDFQNPLSGFVAQGFTKGDHIKISHSLTIYR